MKILSKSYQDKIIYGVCGGLGKYFNIDSTIIRIIFVIFPTNSWYIYLILAMILKYDFRVDNFQSIIDNDLNNSDRIYKSKKEASLGGVCAGIAKHFGWDVSLLRILFAIFTVTSFGIGSILYILLWLLMPSEEDIGS